MFRAKQVHAPTPGAGPGGRLNIKIVFPGMEIPKFKDKTVARPSYL